MMERYYDIDGDSNVEAYEIGTDYIRVKFNGTPKIYTYSYWGAGQGNVEAMKKLARQGDGLNSYINLNAKYRYDK